MSQRANLNLDQVTRNNASPCLPACEIAPTNLLNVFFINRLSFAQSIAYKLNQDENKANHPLTSIPSHPLPRHPQRLAFLNETRRGLRPLYTKLIPQKEELAKVRLPLAH